MMKKLDIIFSKENINGELIGYYEIFAMDHGKLKNGRIKVDGEFKSNNYVIPFAEHFTYLVQVKLNINLIKSDSLSLKFVFIDKDNLVSECIPLVVTCYSDYYSLPLTNSKINKYGRYNSYVLNLGTNKPMELNQVIMIVESFPREYDSYESQRETWYELALKKVKLINKS